MKALAFYKSWRFAHSPWPSGSSSSRQKSTWLNLQTTFAPEHFNTDTTLITPHQYKENAPSQAKPPTRKRTSVEILQRPAAVPYVLLNLTTRLGWRNLHSTPSSHPHCTVPVQLRKSGISTGYDDRIFSVTEWTTMIENIKGCLLFWQIIIHIPVPLVAGISN